MKTKQLFARVGFAVLMALTAPSPSYALQAMTDAQVKQAIIRQSIASDVTPVSHPAITRVLG